MEREILFRGKRIDNGEWVEGYYFKTQIGEQIVRGIIPLDIYADIVVNKKLYQVDQDTAGQYTGLKDRNGKRIFEGDVVKYKNGVIGFVQWQNAECRFLVNIGYDWFVMDDCMYTVIGNIHDNPELLEGTLTC